MHVLLRGHLNAYVTEGVFLCRCSLLLRSEKADLLRAILEWGFSYKNQLFLRLVCVLVSRLRHPLTATPYGFGCLLVVEDDYRRQRTAKRRRSFNSTQPLCLVALWVGSLFVFFCLRAHSLPPASTALERSSPCAGMARAARWSWMLLCLILKGIIFFACSFLPRPTLYGVRLVSPFIRSQFLDNTRMLSYVGDKSDHICNFILATATLPTPLLYLVI